MEPKKVNVRELSLSTPVYSPDFEGSGTIKEIREYEIIVRFTNDKFFYLADIKFSYGCISRDNPQVHVKNLYLEPVKVVPI